MGVGRIEPAHILTKDRLDELLLPLRLLVCLRGEGEVDLVVGLLVNQVAVRRGKRGGRTDRCEPSQNEEAEAADRHHASNHDEQPEGVHHTIHVDRPAGERRGAGDFKDLLDGEEHGALPRPSPQREQRRGESEKPVATGSEVKQLEDSGHACGMADFTDVAEW